MLSPMATGSNGVDAERLEADIRSIPGIRAARVVVEADGRVSEVHVVAGEDKTAKQVVRDIQTLAMASSGTQIDYRVVSVVQLGNGAAADAPSGSPAPRRTLSEMAWTVAGNLTTCRVELAAGEERQSAEVSGPSTGRGRLRLAAGAAAQALEKLDTKGLALDVADVIVTEAGGRRVALVLLIVLHAGGEEMLSGAALVRTDEADAVARAVLDAANRRIEYLRTT